MLFNLSSIHLLHLSKLYAMINLAYIPVYCKYCMYTHYVQDIHYAAYCTVVQNSTIHSFHLKFGEGGGAEMSW